MPSKPIPGSTGEVLTCLPSPYAAHAATGLLYLPRFIAKCKYVKAHGALYNVAVRNETVARAIAAGIAQWNPKTTVFGLAGSPMLDWWRQMGLAVAAEGFADRRYEPDGTLRSRKFPDALITDPQAAAAQAVRLAREGVVQTICVHGDTPGAVEILKACRKALP